MEWIVLGLFCAALILGLILNISMLWALGFGLVLFWLYGRHKGFSWRELAKMTWEGVATVWKILFTFLLIGVMTALWRAAGTVPFIVCQAADLIRPSIFLLMTFLLNCVISVLTGTSFGTAATMGVICAAMGTAMDVSPVLTGGAILSGVFFGDRCSPVSTSALLVAAITETNIYDNIRSMLRSALVPFLLTCGIYAALGLSVHGTAAGLDLRAVFEGSFRLHWTALIPAAVILILAAFRVNVRWAMTASILAAVPVCLLVQRLPVQEVLLSALRGFKPADPEAAALVSGGGVLSMLNVSAIVCISSSYSGLFQKTGLLDGCKRGVDRMNRVAGRYRATLLTSIPAGMAACNQTLAILLTEQLCRTHYEDKKDLALDLEDTAAITSPLVPWCIAGAVPLAMVGAPSTALFLACYLWLIPVWRSLRRRQYGAARAE
ncbi:MAG: sodium:proton antiporter [Oscillospiraceae bacterium]|nr:sodium:proton antiporter [Oscillospiraceae bacterium]